jgi:hypothetical protein
MRTAIGRLFFGSRCGDFYCGLRGFHRQGILSLDYEARGMEFARALTAADNGPNQWSVAATQNGVTVSGAIQVQVNTASPPPPAPPAPPPPPMIDKLSHWQLFGSFFGLSF